MATKHGCAGNSPTSPAPPASGNFPLASASSPGASRATRICWISRSNKARARSGSLSVTGAVRAADQGGGCEAGVPSADGGDGESLPRCGGRHPRCAGRGGWRSRCQSRHVDARAGRRRPCWPARAGGSGWHPRHPQRGRRVLNRKPTRNHGTISSSMRLRGWPGSQAWRALLGKSLSQESPGLPAWRASPRWLFRWRSHWSSMSCRGRFRRTRRIQRRRQMRRRLRHRPHHQSHRPRHLRRRHLLPHRLRRSRARCRRQGQGQVEQAQWTVAGVSSGIL